jgi:hypothetical protein
VARDKKEAQRDYLKRTGYEANNKYNKNNTIMYAIRVVMSTERDIIGKLESVANKSGYIKKLIRDDIAKESPDDT